MRRSERLAHILDQLVANRSVDLDALVATFGVSASTVRRDLESLEQQRLLQRTRAGAKIHPSFNDLPLRFKADQKLDEKRRIAQKARELVGTASVVGMTGGTTISEFARTLVDAGELTVVTNALNIAVELLVSRDLKVFVAGGEGRSSSYEVVGPAAENFLADYNLDLAMLGVDGIDPRAGCTGYDPLGARTTRTLIRQARKTVVLADGSKVGKIAFAEICSINDIHVLVTDRSAPPDVLERIRNAGTEVHVV
jgi:DeoR family transcriptional regulator of aga operon